MVNSKYIHISYLYYVQVENCSKFWFQPKNERQKLEFFSQELNLNLNDIIKPCHDFATLIEIHSEIIVARNHEDQRLYRARLIYWHYDETKDIFNGTVCFIDTGRKQKCKLNDFYIFTKKSDQSTMPAKCFQCKLAEIMPSMSNLSGGNVWDCGAIELFKGFIFDREIKAQVSYLFM